MGKSPVAIAICVGLSPSLAFAADPSATDAAATTPRPAEDAAANLIAPIIVTARRRGENLEKVPVAVTLVDSEKLRTLVINTAQDLTKLAPGLEIGCGGNRDCPPEIRGQTTSILTNQPSVITYFAEVPNFQNSYFDLENVQVLKGPQGTLFGETASAGAVLYTPRRPQNTFGGYLDFQEGNYAYHQLEGAIGGPIVKDKIMFRISGQWRDRRGFTTAYFTDGRPPEDFDNVNLAQWRASLIIKPTERLENYTVYSGSYNHSNGVGSLPRYTDPLYIPPAFRNLVPSAVPMLAAEYQLYTGAPPPPGLTFGQIQVANQQQQNAGGPFAMYTNHESAVKTKFTGFINQTKWSVGNSVTLRNIIAYYWMNIANGGNNVDNSDAPLLEPRPVYLAGTNPADINSNEAVAYQVPSRTLTEEVQALGTAFKGRLTWQTGFYYRHTAQHDFGFALPVLLFGNLSADPAPATLCAASGVTGPCARMTRAESTDYAAYGQATFAILDRLKLTAGYRRSWDTSTSYDIAAPVTYINYMGFNIPVDLITTKPFPDAKPVPSVYPTHSANTYNITLDWQPTNHLLLYIAHRRGYKLGGINTNSPPDDPRRFFGPEIVKDVELGMKADWKLAGIAGRTNIALYRVYDNDVQRTSNVPGSAATVTTNDASAIIQGVEFEQQLALTKWLSVSGSIVYTDAYFTKWIENTTCGTDFWKLACTTLPAATAFVIDHAHGVITGLGAPIHFTPDAFNGASKWKWGIQPTVKLAEWLHNEDVSLSANLYHMSGRATFEENHSITAGGPPYLGNTVFGSSSNPYFAPKLTLLDLQINWRHALGSRMSLTASVTNVTNKVYQFGNSDAFTTIGSASAVTGEPRMYYVSARYEF